ncbi:hypothetical protein Bbelb_296710 [Branchiostoma belcheri]|nr:hypothetical protein Bbelb_296710 [Branchiostoma belcheri]
MAQLLTGGAPNLRLPFLSQSWSFAPLISTVVGYPNKSPLPDPSDTDLFRGNTGLTSPDRRVSTSVRSLGSLSAGAAANGKKLSPTRQQLSGKHHHTSDEVEEEIESSFLTENCFSWHFVCGGYSKRQKLFTLQPVDNFLAKIIAYQTRGNPAEPISAQLETPGCTPDCGMRNVLHASPRFSQPAPLH